MHSFEDEVVPPAPSIGEPAARLRALAVAAFLPIAVTLLGIAPFALLPMLDGADRALVWIEGDAHTIATATGLLDVESAFSGGISGGTLHEIPEGCSPGASRLHFDVRRVDEAQVARVALEQLAAEAGARVCASGRFEIGRPGDALTWTPLAAALSLPLALLMGLRLASIAPRPRRGLAPAIALVLATAIVVVAPPVSIAATLALPAIVGVAMASALIHEAAFRGWLLERSIPVLGIPGAAALSIAASTAAAAATDGMGGTAAAAVIAVTCSATYARTRSTTLSVAVHAIAAAALRAAAG